MVARSNTAIPRKASVSSLQALLLMVGFYHILEFPSFLILQLFRLPHVVFYDYQLKMRVLIIPNELIFVVTGYVLVIGLVPLLSIDYVSDIPAV